MGKEETKEKGFDKPSYDGRQEYYDHAKQYWDAIATCFLDKDYEKTLIALNGYFSFIRAYIDSDSQTRLDKIDAIAWKRIDGSKNLGNAKVTGTYMIQIRKLLIEYRKELFIADRYLKLPIKSQEEEEFDEDEL